MGRGALRGAATAWLALIALQAVATNGGSGRISELLGDVNRLVDRVLDPTVPAIPDRRAGAAPAPARTRTAPAPATSRYGSADAAERWTTPTR